MGLWKTLLGEPQIVSSNEPVVEMHNSLSEGAPKKGDTRIKEVVFADGRSEYTGQVFAKGAYRDSGKLMWTDIEWWHSSSEFLVERWLEKYPEEGTPMNRGTLNFAKFIIDLYNERVTATTEVSTTYTKYP